MNSRERFLTALTGGIPDRVPVTPDISNMVPCRRTGKPFWEIYYRNDPPLWRAYLDAARYYGIDPWFNYGEMHYQYADRETKVVQEDQRDDCLVVRFCHRNRAGERYSTVRFGRDNPPSNLEYAITDLRADLEWIRASLEPPVGCDPAHLRAQREAVGPEVAFALGLDYPGLQHWFGQAAGGLERLVYWAYDEPELMEEWRRLVHEKVMAQLELILEARPDYIMLNGSGTITLQNPTLARRFSLPTVQAVCRKAAEAGIPTLLHSCGKSRAWIRMLAEETELSGINPLEIPPMGDITLAEAKEQYGQRLCLMGNLHTTQVMLLGTPAEVREACRRAIEEAGAGGGFILSTGDQCGRDTPDENLFAMVAAAEEFGRYSDGGLHGG